jgi:hypothetical protein
MMPPLLVRGGSPTIGATGVSEAGLGDRVAKSLSRDRDGGASGVLLLSKKLGWVGVMGPPRLEDTLEAPAPVEGGLGTRSFV